MANPYTTSIYGCIRQKKWRLTPPDRLTLHLGRLYLIVQKHNCSCGPLDLQTNTAVDSLWKNGIVDA
jgi:hypothetical protein